MHFLNFYQKSSFFLLAGMALAMLLVPSVQGDDELPSGDYPASRYENLWKKSPFTLASPDEVAPSAEFSLVGVSRFNGTECVNLIEKSTAETFLLSKDKPKKGLTLVSVQFDPKNGSSAMIQHNGEVMNLKIEPPVATGMPGMPTANTMPNMTPGALPPGQVFPNQFQPGQMTPQQIAALQQQQAMMNQRPPRILRQRPMMHIPSHP